VSSCNIRRQILRACDNKNAAFVSAGTATLVLRALASECAMRRCTALRETISGPSTRTAANTPERSTKTKRASRAQPTVIHLAAPSMHARRAQQGYTVRAARQNAPVALNLAELCWVYYSGLSPVLPWPGW